MRLWYYTIHVDNQAVRRDSNEIHDSKDELGDGISLGGTVSNISHQIIDTDVILAFVQLKEIQREFIILEYIKCIEDFL